MSLVATALSTHVLADAAAVVAGRRIASGRFSLPPGREAAEAYAASLAYDALVRPMVDATLPPIGVVNANLALKAGSFVLLDHLAERFIEGRSAPMSSLREFFIVGASLAASAIVQPMLPGGSPRMSSAPRAGGAGTNPAVTTAAALRPLDQQ